jgi:hypothetical protein
MSSAIRREIPFAIAFIAIVTMFGEYIFVPFSGVAIAMREIAVIIAGFAIIVGGVMLAIVHGHLIIRRQTGYLYSVCCLVALFGMVVVGFLPPMGGSDQFNWTFTSINGVAERTVYASLAFWITAAAYRALKAKSLEATLMLISALVCCFANAPIAAMVGPFTEMQSWLLAVPSTGAYRGIIITTACGLIALGARTLIGRERRWGE